jgi:uncharacterized protein (DUF2141 family)
MKTRKSFKFLVGCVLIVPSLAFGALPALTVNVTNALPPEGTVEITLFNSEETFMKEVHLQESGTPDENGAFSASFANLEEGEYAVVVVHDENGNETYDAGVLGFGSEGLGYSNNVRQWLFRPGFDEIKFSIEGESTEIDIHLH